MTDCLKEIVAATTVEAVWGVLTREMAHFGFDRLLYGFTRYRTATSLGNSDDMMILSNHPDDYVERFVGDGMFADAPMVVWATQNVGAMSWSWLHRQDHNFTPEQRAVLDFNRVRGVTAGFTISFPDSSSRRKAAVALTARLGMSQCQVDAIWARHGETIDLINQVAHLKMAALPSPKSLLHLSDRQREVLEWVGDGKTVQDVATIMGLKPATVEKHLRNARESLQVETTAQAVMKASLQMQLFLYGR